MSLIALNFPLHGLYTKTKVSRTPDLPTNVTNEKRPIPLGSIPLSRVLVLNLFATPSSVPPWRWDIYVVPLQEPITYHLVTFPFIFNHYTNVSSIGIIVQVSVDLA